MRVIARRTLKNFVANNVQREHRRPVQSQLDAWFEEASKASWKNSAEVKRSYGAASIVSADRVVFNIKGNDYRLIVKVDYFYQVVLVLWLGSHREYDTIDVKTVQYDKERYEDSSHRDRR